jgi:hypothetical protein
MTHLRIVVLSSLAIIAGCAAPESEPVSAESTLEARDALSIQASREHVAGDVFHTTFDVRIGSAPNAVLRIHRVTREIAPGIARPSKHAVMMLHGDFATFVTNFLPTKGDPASSAPGIAPYLASLGEDVWGLDRRWTLPAADGDTSDFGEMGVAEELDDLDRAIAFARTTRLLGGAGFERITLAGFSHGGELAYAFAAMDGARPNALRQIGALAPIDIYYDIAPEDADARAFACSNAASESDQVAQGNLDADNSFFIGLGQFDRSAPDDISPIFGDPFTNRDAMFFTVGLTYQFAPYTPLYHLIAPNLDADGNVASLRETTEDAASAWLAGAPFHGSMREQADLDAIWCGQAPLPIDVSLADIRVPVFYTGAAGAFGAHGLFTLSDLGTHDITTNVVAELPADDVAEDTGHGDLLFGSDARTVAWTPLAGWLLAH